MQNLKTTGNAQPTIENGAELRPQQSLDETTRLHLFRQLRQHVQRSKNTLSSGNAELDKQLGGGWPKGCLIEILGGHYIQPLIPLLKTLCDQQRSVAWINPPYTPYPPGLQQQGLPAALQLLIQPEKPGDAFWSMEQLLRSRRCGAVLCWQEPKTPHNLRRLQLAAEAGDSIALLYRPASVVKQASPAAVRLLLQRRNGELYATLIKVRGGAAGKPLLLPEAGYPETKNSNVNDTKTSRSESARQKAASPEPSGVKPITPELIARER